MPTPDHQSHMLRALKALFGGSETPSPKCAPLLASSKDDVYSNYTEKIIFVDELL